MAFDSILRRTHRAIAVLFFLTVPPAGYFSITATGTEVSPVVYFPLFPLFGLMLTGGYLLAKPWVLWIRAS